MRTGRRVHAHLLVMALALLLAACGSSGAHPTGGQALKIGVVVPLTGPYGAIGQAALAGVQAEADLLNQEGGILGRKVEILSRDDAADPGRARAAAEDLVENAGVEAMIPEFFPNSINAILPVTQSAKLITIEAAPTLDFGDPGQHPYNFAYSVPFELYPGPMAAGIKAVGGKRVGLLVNAGSSGEGQGNVIDGAMPRYGLEVVDYEKYDPASNDVTPQLQKLKNAGADVLVISAPGSLLGVVMDGVRDLAWKVPVVGTIGTPTGDIAKLIPSQVASQFSAVTYRILARSKPDAVDPQYRSFVRALRRQGPILNLLTSANHADMIRILKWGFDKAGSTDPGKVKTALETMSGSKIEPGTFLVLSNPRYSARTHTVLNADLANNFALIKDGQLVDGTYPGSPLAPARPIA